MFERKWLLLKTYLEKLLDEKSDRKSKYFYNIMPIDNIPSVIENGLLSYYNAKSCTHVSVALEGVQDRREAVKIPNGGKLHSYANLYFSCRNPMMYRRKDEAEDLCVLVFSTSVLNIPGCILSDQNASTDLVKFYTPEDGLNNINFNLVFAKYWTHEDHYEQCRRKAIKCAEILVPDCVPYDYVLGAYVLNNESEQKLLDLGFDKKVKIDRAIFFR